MAAQFQPPYLRNPMGRAGTDFPTGTGTYAWNGATQTWSVLPSGSGTYGWDGTSQSWVPVAGGSGMGVTDGSNAAPGQIGEVMTASNGTGVPVVVQAPAPNITPLAGWAATTSIPLTAGDWDVSGIAAFDTPAPATNMMYAHSTISLSATSPPSIATWPAGWTYMPIPTSESIGFSTGTERQNVTGPTTVYLVGCLEAINPTDVGQTGTFYGYIYARRVR